MSELEQRLLDASEHFSFPETPDVVARLQPGRRRSGRRRPFAILAAATLVAAAAVLAVSPAARSGAAGWFAWVPGVEVEQAETLRPFPLDAAPPFLGREASLDEARAELQFEPRVPEPGLGEPAVWVRNDVIGGIVTFVYGDADEPHLVLSEWLAENGTARYQVAGPRGRIVQTQVAGRPAIWIEGDARAVYNYLGADLGRHQEQLPVSANVLLWRDGPVAFRLEARTDLEEAMDIARSLRERTDVGEAMAISLATPVSLQADAQRARRRTGAPGVILFAKVGRQESVAAAGLSSLRPRRRARGGDRFWIGSVTKTYTAAVVLQLVGEGRLALDDPVTRWLPEIPNGERITVRRLLDHTSGLPDYFRVPQIARRLANPRALVPTAELIRIAASEPRDFEPGTSYGYSSTNYLVLGEIVKRVTGRGIGVEIRSRIIGRLGLSRATYGRPKSPMRGYHLAGGKRRDVTTWSLGGPSAAGAVWSDARDVSRFFSALLGGELVGPAEREEMLTVTPPSLMGLGIGFIRGSCGRVHWGHGGATPGFATYVLATRDGSTVVVAAANEGDRHAVHHELYAAAQRLFCRLTA